MLSRRSRVDLGPNRLAAALAARAARGQSHLDLTVSNPTAAGMPYDSARIGEALASAGALPYEPSALGLLSARSAIAQLWHARGIPVQARHVALTASTSEAYSFLFKLLCDPGDAVLVPRPSYPLFEHLARYEGVEVLTYPLLYDGAWHVDLPALAAAVTPRTRSVVVVSPNNPTGSFLKQDELQRIAGLGLPVISDEVFGTYAFGDDPRRARGALEANGVLVFALDGLSKLAGLPQLKLAWLTVGGPPPLVEPAWSALELVLDTFLSPSGPVQHALPVLLEAGALTHAAIGERIAGNLALLRSAAKGSALTSLTVEGGWYAVLRLPGIRSEEDWTLGLLADADVLVQPGWFYDFHEEPYWVVSLLTPGATFAEGVARMVRHVEA